MSGRPSSGSELLPGEQPILVNLRLTYKRAAIPLLEAAIERMKIPNEYAFEVSVFSEAPSGASTGTSAAVTVALIGALDCLTPGRMTPHEAAYTAQ